MALKKSWHCAYDVHYHLVFPAKYRKALLRPEVEAELVRISQEISARYDIEFEQMGADRDHIHLLCSAHPKRGPGEIVRIYKSITARELFRTFPDLGVVGRRVLERWLLCSDGGPAQHLGDGRKVRQEPGAAPVGGVAPFRAAVASWSVRPARAARQACVRDTRSNSCWQREERDGFGRPSFFRYPVACHGGDSFLGAEAISGGGLKSHGECPRMAPRGRDMACHAHFPGH